MALDGLTLALANGRVVAVAIIAVLTMYLGVARDLAFWPRFLQVSLISF